MKDVRIKKFVLLLMMCCSGISVTSQNCDLTLHGEVRDADNSESLGFSIARLLTSNETVQSDEHGVFAFRNLCAGRHQVLISHAGCKDTVFSVDLTRSARIVFRLPHHLNILKDIEVVAEHKGPAPTQAAAVLEGRQLEQSRGENLADQLKQLNGVTTFNTGATVSKPMINGMQGYRILILNNGIRQEGQQWGNEHAPEIDPFIAQKLTVIRGASAMRYGSDAIGGVILVEPGSLPDTAAITGAYNGVLNSNGRGHIHSLKLEGYLDRIRHFSWRVHGTFKKTGNLKTPDYYLSNTASEERNFSYALAYHRRKFGLSIFYSQFNAQTGIYPGAHIGNLTDLYAAFNRSKPLDSSATFSYGINRPYQNIGHELLKLSGDLHTGKRSRFHASYAYQYNLRQEFDKHLPKNNALASQNLPEADYRITTQLAEVFWEHDYIRSWRGQFGLQGMHQENRYTRRFFIPNYVNRTAGLFATERFIRQKYEIEAGARYDYKILESYFYENNSLLTPVREFSNVSLSLGAIYKPNSSLRFNLHAANGWRAPAPNELYSNGLHHGVGAVERGKKDLKKEECFSVTGSGIITLKKARLEMTGYSYMFRNFIYYEPGSMPELTIRGAFPAFNYTQNDAVINGGDLLISYYYSRQIEVTARAMTVHGRNTGKDEHLVYMPADRAEVKVRLNFRDRDRFTGLYFEPLFQVVAKQRRVPEGVDFAPPPDGYWLAGFHLGATFRVRRQRLSLTLSATNITNNSYRDYLDRFRYYADSPGANYVLKLRIPFTLYDKQLN